MTALARYHAENLPALMEKIRTNGIFMDDYFDRFFNETTTNYPPYNLVQVSNTQSRLEVALAGFKKKEVKVYTEYGKLTIEANVDEKEEATFLHRGLARRSFTRSWAIPDDTEVREVKFSDGLLTVELGKVVPEHHARKDYL
jgi:HSP20 family molecular chaperone IbpA|tara:strand:+ start:33 stop:458 length:426 start_codon:yes stop_codon:yes gene_type:complete